MISSELNICDVQLGKMSITLCGFSGGAERCIKKYPRATMEQDSMIQKNLPLQKCWSVNPQQNPDGSDMFLAVSSVQLITI